MPRVKPGERKRARHPKTRTGCLTCRARRIKCDESRPRCRRCTSTGRQCDGYAPAEVEDLVGELPGLTEQPVMLWAGRAASFREERAFDFFRHITVDHIPGSCDRNLWTSLLLSASHEDLGIRHAIVALGTLHEYYVNTGETERIKDDFAMRQYNAAIRQHVERLSQEPSKHITSYIVACILFICIELLQMHYESALSLLNKSVRLFYDEAVRESETSPWPLDVIELVLQRLQMQTVSLFGSHAVYRPQTSSMRSAESRQIPKKFRSVDEARDFFEAHYFSWALSDRSLTGENFRVYTELYHKWSKSYDALMASPDWCRNKRDEKTAKLLSLHRTVMLNTFRRVAEPIFTDGNIMLDDRFNDDREKVISLAEGILNGSDVAEADSSETPYRFTLEIGVVGPLFDIAWECRDPLLRRQALDLLRKHPRREGFWDGILASRKAAHILDLEESAGSDVTSAADIPTWARISQTVDTFSKDDERRVTVEFQRGDRPGSNNEHGSIRQVIEW